MSFATPAGAAGDMPDMSGRWKNAGDMRNVVLDITRCGDGYCGREIVANACGGIVLRFGTPKRSGDMWDADGILDLPSEGRHYTAIVGFEPFTPTLHVDAYVSAPSIEHREIPFEEEFVRIGTASCPGPAA